MLVELKIENFGIIENLRIRPGNGLNVITGETGAGKSLLLQALDAVLGSRTGAGVVRNGAHRALIEALFDLRDSGDVRSRLEENGYSLEDGYLILQREIAVDGRGRCMVNRVPARVGFVRSLATRLIEVHGQHEHQRILDPETHLDSLDRYAATLPLREKTAELYHRYAGIRKRLRSVILETDERERRLDYLKFALEEIESFEPRENEYQELEHEQALIRNSGQMFSDLNAVYAMLREEENSVLDRIYTAESLLEGHCHLHDGIESRLLELREARYALEGLTDFLREEKDALQFSPERQEDIDERLNGYRRLHKKYGGNTQAVLQAQNDFLRELSVIEMSEEEAELLKSEIEVVHSELRELAEELSRKRRSVVHTLEEQIRRELADLGMPGSDIKVAIRRELSGDSPVRENPPPEDHSGASAPRRENNDARSRYLINEKGLDRVEFLMRTNAGEALLPLRKIASGGEMSRITLALKSIIMEQNTVQTVVFDEVDAGVGGEVACTIASRLKEHALHNQVIVITHLHQVAGAADHHFFIAKQTENGRTITRVQRLQGERRLHEMARMLGGNRPGPIVLEHAREILSRTAS